jgi:VWFA-related protein
MRIFRVPNQARTTGGLTVCLLLALVAGATAQQSGDPQVPDAPSATRPVPQFPPTPPAKNLPPREPEEKPAAQEPAAEPVPIAVTDQAAPRTTPTSAPLPTTPSQEELFKVVKLVNFVLVPVTVKDDAGRLVDGLLPKDFQVMENGERQELKFFTSDPFPISAAIVFDLGLPDNAVHKIQQTFPALEGAFTQYDELSIYSYSSAVRRVSDFGALSQQLTAVFNQLKTERGRNAGPPVVGGPFGSGPTYNGAPVAGQGPIVITPTKESHVLNDALLQAAVDLGKRDRTRRKVILIVSDGRELGSRASYEDVLKVLLTNGITVFALAVDSAAIPVFNKLERLHLPRQGYNNILPKYTSATGGEVYTQFSQEAIEAAYSHALGDARNQYTLGYNSKAIAGGAYRTLEVRVARLNLKVISKDGFYPAPPAK